MSRKGDDLFVLNGIVKGLAVNVIGVYNFFGELLFKFELLEKSQASLEEALRKLKASDSIDAAAIEKTEKALSDIVTSMQKLNDQLDTVNGILVAVEFIGDITEKAIDAVVDLEGDFKVSERVKSTLISSVDEVKKASKKIEEETKRLAEEEEKARQEAVRKEEDAAASAKKAAEDAAAASKKKDD